MNASMPRLSRIVALLALPSKRIDSRAWLLPAAALAVAAMAWAALRPAAAPQALAASAPLPVFSAARALPHVRYLTQAPRPIASAANARARHYILERLRAAGLDPELQTAPVQRALMDQHGNVQLTAAIVNNIVLRKQGVARDRATRPALMLATHYDTGPRSLGAADAGAQVAAVLETLRALQHGAPLAGDLVVLIADGAEAGSLGARAFADQHPWARQVGLVLNFDGGGSSGPLVLRDTHGASDAALRGWTQSVPLALGSSAMNEAAGYLASAQDTAQLKKIGSAGLHFANLEGRTGYLGALDTPARLDAGTLQHSGDTMLALARHFGNPAEVAAPPAQGAAAAQGGALFTLPAIGLVHYAGSAVWPLTRFACLLFFGVCCLALSRGDADLSDIANGAGGFVVIGALLAFAAYTLQLFPFVEPGFSPAMAARAHDHWHLLAFAALASGLFILMQRRLQAIIGATGAALGALLAMLMLLLAASSLAPAAAYVLAWPVIGALLALGVLQLPRADAWPHPLRVLVLVAGLAPAVFLLAPVVEGVFTLIPGRTNPPIAALALLLGSGTALLAALDRRFLVRTLGLACALCLGLAGPGAAVAVDEPAPLPNRLTYYQDATTWRAYWLLPAQDLDGWNKRFFPDAGEPRELTEVFGHGSAQQWFAVAPRSAVAFPYIEVLKDDEDYVQRHVEFMLQSKNGAPTIEVRVEGARPIRSRLNGRTLTGELSATWALTLHGMGRQRLNFGFDMEAGKPFKIVIRERIPGLPPHGLPARPGNMAPAVIPMTETTIAADTLVFR